MTKSRCNSAVNRRIPLRHSGLRKVNRKHPKTSGKTTSTVNIISDGLLLRDALLSTDLGNAADMVYHHSHDKCSHQDVEQDTHLDQERHVMNEGQAEKIDAVFDEQVTNHLRQGQG